MTTELDKTDRAILAALQNDGRMSNARLAETVGLSETPCARRLKRLENDGYIDQYRAMLSRAALGLGVFAFVYVRFAVHDRAVATRFEREVQAIPRILACHNVSGSADYILQVVARDLDDYGTFMRDEMRSLPGVTSVESALSLREVKANGGLPPSCTRAWHSHAFHTARADQTSTEFSWITKRQEPKNQPRWSAY